MVPENEFRRVIESCKGAIQRKNFSSAAYCLVDLVDAEKAGLASPAWRNEIDVAAAEAFLSQHSDALDEKWTSTLHQLDSLLKTGLGLIYEEMVSVLSQRDALEQLPRYMDRDPRAQLKTIEKPFNRMLSRQLELVEEAREETVINIARYLPAHWWWRVDIEGFPPGADM